MTPATTNGNALAEKARSIDQIAAAAMELFQGAGSFEAELGVAKAIQDLRAALTPDVMVPVMALMNTRLGFQTDRDPKRPAKANQERPQPYSVDVVRDVVIEAKLRGFHVVGNEFNIIAGNFYAAHDGLKRRCETWPGVTEFKWSIGLPRNASSGQGAVVTCKATWKKQASADAVEAEIAVKTDSYSSADQIVGKAERKLFKRVFDRLSGRVTPDGEVGEDEPAQIANANPSTPPPPAPPAVAPPSAPIEPPSPVTPPAVELPKAGPRAFTLEPVGYKETTPTQAPTSTAAPSFHFALTELQTQLSELVSGAGSKLDTLRGWCADQLGHIPVIKGVQWDSITSFGEIPDAACRWLLNNSAGVTQQLQMAERS